MDKTGFGRRRLGLIGTVLAMLGFAAGATAQPAGMPPVGEEYRPSGFPETFSETFYPGTELRAVPLARARVLAARAEFRRADSALNNAVEDLRLTFKRSDELREAQAEEREAYAELERVRNEALASLKQDSNYQAAVALRQRLAGELERRRENQVEPVSIDDLLALATVKLGYSTTASAMEAAAVSADPRVRAARQRLVRAGKRLTELHEAFDNVVRTSPVVINARTALADARAMALASEGFYIEARDNREWATRYAYFVSRPHGIVYNNPYYQDPYLGYGGGSIGYPANWWQGARPMHKR